MKTILADDHALFRGGFALLFQQLDASSTILEADDLAGAMALAELHSDTDLLLLDLHMPDMHGASSIRAVTRAYPQLPLVILSADESDGMAQQVIEAGALGFIPKSSTASVMLAAIRLVLSGGIYVPAHLIMATQGANHDHDHGAIQLTTRQLDVLRLLADGMTNKDICRRLNISQGTVKVHIAAIFRALNVSNRTEAARMAAQLLLLD
jgi:two-component system, NarL family, nitrate/nitrite response regulator NarL